MAAPLSCAFCGEPLLLSKADRLMGLLDCGACGRWVQLDATALAANGEKPTALTAVACHRCKKPLSRATLEPQYGVARCEGCGTVNDLGGRFRTAKAKHARQHARQPRCRLGFEKRGLNDGRFRLRELPGALEIS